MKTLDTACRRILEAKYKLGLFDNSYKYCDLSRPARDIFTKEHRDVARKIASESFVLLKNEPAKPDRLPCCPCRKGNGSSHRSLGKYEKQHAGNMECGGKAQRLSFPI